MSKCQKLSLITLVSRSKILDITNQLGPWKSSGLDGFHVGFYKTYWDIIDDDVTNLIQNVLASAYPWEDINKTNIILPPKVKNCMYPTDYRSISPCNIVYKIIAKIFSNRISSVLPSLISHNQVDFVKHRLIIDSAMLGLDLIHHIYNKSFHVNMVLKLDVTKAFD